MLVCGACLTKGPVVLGATPKACWQLRNRGDRRELTDLETAPGDDSSRPWIDRAVQVLPIHSLERIAGVRTAAPVRAEPDAAVGAAEDMRRVARVERERVEVRVLVPAEVLPRRAAVVGAEDPARADAVVELTGREDDVRIVRIDLDHIVVEALPT